MTLNSTGRGTRYPVDVTIPQRDLLALERQLFVRGEVVVGIDEVGRGALAGPLTVGAVALNRECRVPSGLTDSKLLTAARRESLVAPLHRWALDWALGSVSAYEVDQWGVRLALAVAATRAIEGLRVQPTFALLDGPFNLLRAPSGVVQGALDPPPLHYGELAHSTVVRGDQWSATVAAASVLAKVHRDREMVGLHDEFEIYGWAQNKGYGVPAHLEALRQYGPSPHHRQTWHLPVRTTIMMDH